MEFKTFATHQEQALQQLEFFIHQHLKDYNFRRNFDEGPDRKNVSLLSPLIKHQVLSETQVIASCLKFHTFIEIEKFIQELCWRNYWKNYLEKHPYLWHSYVDEVQPLKNSHQNQSIYIQACSGSTDIAAFNEWAHEIVSTGYLHNHARMWFASIWIYTFKLPWQLGAHLFQKHLLDFDPASNTLSWRWVAGLHTQGKQYLARADNIAKFSSKKVSPEHLAGDTFPIDDASNPSSNNMQIKTQNVVWERAPKNILFHSECMNFEGLPKDYAPHSVYFLALSKNTCSEKSFLYQKMLYDDFQKRCQLRFDNASFKNVSPSDASALKDQTLLIPRTFQGFIYSELYQIQNKYSCAYETIQNTWQEYIETLPAKGFFPFWKALKKYLQARHGI